MNNIITNYADFLRRASMTASMWYIIEYSPEELGYSSDKNENYCNDVNRYALFRSEILAHPGYFATRLDEGAYRIWTTTPIEYPW